MERHVRPSLATETSTGLATCRLASMGRKKQSIATGDHDLGMPYVNGKAHCLLYPTRQRKALPTTVGTVEFVFMHVSLSGHRTANSNRPSTCCQLFQRCGVRIWMWHLLPLSPAYHLTRGLQSNLETFGIYASVFQTKLLRCLKAKAKRGCAQERSPSGTFPQTAPPLPRNSPQPSRNLRRPFPEPGQPGRT